jgi:capsule polysaccharide export protein KpsC/LpsZ
MQTQKGALDRFIVKEHQTPQIEVEEMKILVITQTIVTIALENDVLEKIKYEDIIEDFISKNTRQWILFSGT